MPTPAPPPPAHGPGLAAFGWWNTLFHPRDERGRFADGAAGGAHDPHQPYADDEPRPADVTPAQMPAPLRERAAAWAAALTPAESAAVADYTARDFRPLNTALAASGGDPSPLPPPLRDLHDRLAAAVAKFDPPAEPVTVWRGAELPAATADAILAAVAAGGEVTFPAFSSCSVSPRVALALTDHGRDGRAFPGDDPARPGRTAPAKCLLFEVRARSGAWVGGGGEFQSLFARENEWLLAPKARLRVAGVKTVRFAGGEPFHGERTVIQLDEVPRESPPRGAAAFDFDETRVRRVNGRFAPKDAPPGPAAREPHELTEDEFRAAPPPGFVYDHTLTHEADVHSHPGKVTVGPKFFRVSNPADRKHILTHEAGHALSDLMLDDGSAFRLMSQGAYTARVVGPDGAARLTTVHDRTPGENAAESYARLVHEPDEFRRHFPRAHRATAEAALRHGFPVPPSALAPYPDLRLHAAAGTRPPPPETDPRGELLHGVGDDRQAQLLHELVALGDLHYDPPAGLWRLGGRAAGSAGELVSGPDAAGLRTARERRAAWDAASGGLDPAARQAGERAVRARELELKYVAPWLADAEFARDRPAPPPSRGAPVPPPPARVPFGHAPAVFDFDEKKVVRDHGRFAKKKGDAPPADEPPDPADLEKDFDTLYATQPDPAARARAYLHWQVAGEITAEDLTTDDSDRVAADLAATFPTERLVRAHREAALAHGPGGEDAYLYGEALYRRGVPTDRTSELGTRYYPPVAILAATEPDPLKRAETYLAWNAAGEFPGADLDGEDRERVVADLTALPPDRLADEYVTAARDGDAGDAAVLGEALARTPPPPPAAFDPDEPDGWAVIDLSEFPAGDPGPDHVAALVRAVPHARLGGVYVVPDAGPHLKRLAALDITHDGTLDDTTSGGAVGRVFDALPGHPLARVADAPPGVGRGEPSPGDWDPDAVDAYKRVNRDWFVRKVSTADPDADEVAYDWVHADHVPPLTHLPADHWDGLAASWAHPGSDPERVERAEAAEEKSTAAGAAARRGAAADRTRATAATAGLARLDARARAVADRTHPTLDAADRAFAAMEEDSQNWAGGWEEDDDESPAQDAATDALETLLTGASANGASDLTGEDYDLPDTSADEAEALSGQYDSRDDQHEAYRNAADELTDRLAAAGPAVAAAERRALADATENVRRLAGYYGTVAAAARRVTAVIPLTEAGRNNRDTARRIAATAAARQAALGELHRRHSGVGFADDESDAAWGGPGVALFEWDEDKHERAKDGKFGPGGGTAGGSADAKPADAESDARVAAKVAAESPPEPPAPPAVLGRVGVGEIPAAVTAPATTWQAGLASGQYSAIDRYTDTDYSDINQFLSKWDGNPAALGRDVAGDAKKIDAAVRQFPAHEPWTSYRGLCCLTPAQVAQISAGYDAAHATGEPVTLKGFASSSLDPAMAAFWGPTPKTRTAVMLEMVSPRTAYIAGVSSKPHELELLQPHGDTYRITGVREQVYEKDGEQRTVRTYRFEAVPEPPPNVLGGKVGFDWNADDHPRAAGGRFGGDAPPPAGPGAGVALTRVRPDGVPAHVAAAAAAWAGGLGDRQAAAVTGYTHTDHLSVNTLLRDWDGDPAALAGQAGTTARRIDAAIREFPSHEPWTAYRGVYSSDPANLAAVRAGLDAAHATGEPMTLKGFASASLNPVLAAFWGEGGRRKPPVVLEIVSPRGAYIAPASVSPHELEVLHPHGDSYRVAGVRDQVYDCGWEQRTVRTYRLEAVPAPPPDTLGGSAKFGGLPDSWGDRDDRDDDDRVRDWLAAVAAAARVATVRTISPGGGGYRPGNPGSGSAPPRTPGKKAAAFDWNPDLHPRGPRGRFGGGAAGDAAGEAAGSPATESDPGEPPPDPITRLAGEFRALAARGAAASDDDLVRYRSDLRVYPVFDLHQLHGRLGLGDSTVARAKGQLYDEIVASLFAAAGRPVPHPGDDPRSRQKAALWEAAFRDRADPGRPIRDAARAWLADKADGTHGDAAQLDYLARRFGVEPAGEGRAGAVVAGDLAYLIERQLTHPGERAVENRNLRKEFDDHLRRKRAYPLGPVAVGKLVDSLDDDGVDYLTRSLGLHRDGLTPALQRERIREAMTVAGSAYGRTPRSDALVAELTPLAAAGGVFDFTRREALRERLEGINPAELEQVHRELGLRRDPGPGQPDWRGMVKDVVAHVTPPIAARLAADHAGRELVARVAALAAPRPGGAAERAAAEWRLMEASEKLSDVWGEINAQPDEAARAALKAATAARRKELDDEIETQSRLMRPDQLARDRVEEILKTNDPVPWKVKSDGCKRIHREAADEAVRFLTAVLARAGGPAVPAAVTIRQTATRARARREGIPGDPPRGTVWLSDGNVATAVHEFGHQVEYHVPGVQAAANDFLAHRVKDEALTSLRGRFPDHDYDADERGREDDFGKFFGAGSSKAYYCGKHYEGGTTEVVSMGVEALYRDPVGFCAKDPEYAAFIVGVLRGTVR